MANLGTRGARFAEGLVSGKSEGIVNTITNFGLGFQSIGGLDAVKNANAFRLATGFSATGAIGLAGAVGAGAGVVSGVMDGTGPIDGGLGGLATGALASAAVVGGAVMTKQGRKIVDRIGRAKGGKIAEKYNARSSSFDSIADLIHSNTKGEGDQWTNFSRNAYTEKSPYHMFEFQNKKPAKTGSDKSTAIKVKPLQQATAGTNPGSAAVQAEPYYPSIPKGGSSLGLKEKTLQAINRDRQALANTPNQTPTSTASSSVPTPSQAPVSTASSSVPAPTRYTPHQPNEYYGKSRRESYLTEGELNTSFGIGRPGYEGGLLSQHDLAGPLNLKDIKISGMDHGSMTMSTFNPEAQKAFDQSTERLNAAYPHRNKGKASTRKRKEAEIINETNNGGNLYSQIWQDKPLTSGVFKRDYSGFESTPITSRYIPGNSKSVFQNANEAYTKHNIFSFSDVSGRSSFPRENRDAGSILGFNKSLGRELG